MGTLGEILRFLRGWPASLGKKYPQHAATQILQILPGTIWPKPSVFHVRATEQFLRQLAALAERHAGPEICDHFHAYDGNQGLMQWYDAFSGDPLLVDESVGEMKVQTFIRKLGVPYARWRAANKAATNTKQANKS
jgi:hypothetical protein